MVIQAHRITIGEETTEAFSLSLQQNATILHIHNHAMPHEQFEIVEMHLEFEECVLRRFLVVDTFCCEPTTAPNAVLHFIGGLTFDFHVWNVFEVLD